MRTVIAQPLSPRAGRARDVPHGARGTHAYVQLRDLIVRGELAAGMRMTEHDCAGRLRVSRTPVREALDRLRREGFLVPTADGLRTELVVAPLDPVALADFWALIGFVEGVAVGAIDDMSRQECETLATTLARVNDELARAVARRPSDPVTVVSLLAEFHAVLIRGCGRRHLVPLHDTLIPHIQRFDFAHAAFRSDYRTTLREHRAIIEVVRQRDATRARRLIEAHWRAGYARTVRQQRATRGDETAPIASWLPWRGPGRDGVYAGGPCPAGSDPLRADSAMPL